MNLRKYDQEKCSKAGKGAALRAVVAAYVAYLAFKIAAAENTSMSLTTARIIGAVFIAADIAFVIYACNLFRREIKAAIITDEAAETGEGTEAENE